jgi:hypothetical protein
MSGKARNERVIRRGSRGGWGIRLTKNWARFRRRESGWLDFDMKSNLNLFATGAVLIHKGRKP